MYVNSDLISVILKPDSSPVKRLKQLAEEKGILLQCLIKSQDQERACVKHWAGCIDLSSAIGR
ncbi:MAG: DUF370 domain-containing protein [Deltaproteobacteria bacterium]|nr:DUF370 domain-containing protein [Deltaproteobacteria bacterium]